MSDSAMSPAFAQGATAAHVQVTPCLAMRALTRTLDILSIKAVTTLGDSVHKAAAATT